MPGKPVQIGPFNGGLNNISKAGEARDDEVVELINMEVSLDTSVVSRPPIKVMEQSVISNDYPSNWEVLGIYRVTDSEWYVIVNRPTGATTNRVEAHAQGNITTTPSYIIRSSTGLNNQTVAMVQFQDKCYFNVGPLASDTGYSWEKVGGYTAIAAMPKGYIMVSWKSRIWVAGTNTGSTGDRVWFSDIDAGGLKPNEWNAADFFDVAPGEGGFITAMIPSFNNMIIFKSDGTWRFSYPSDPGDGQVDKISGQVGAASANAVVEFENFIYVYDQGRVYELINGNYSQLNLNVRFEVDPEAVDSVATGVDLSIVNRRLVVRYFNALYVFTVDTKSWSQWRSYAGTPGKFVEMPTNSLSSESPTYLAGSRGATQRATLNLINQDYSVDYLRNAPLSGSLNEVNDLTVENGAITVTIGVGGGTNPYWLQLNNGLGDTEYNIPVGPGQKFQLKYTLATTDITTHTAIIEYLLLDGTTAFGNHVMTVGTNVTAEFIVPATAILAKVYIKAEGLADATVTTYSNLEFTRKSVTAPKTILNLVDNYSEVVTAKEYIECKVRTKSYDFKAPSVFKRMFWWGIDVLSIRKVNMEARPIGKTSPLMWGDLLAFTTDQLQAGTWGNPLEFQTVSLSVVDSATPGAEISENGRFFVKALKGLRFRQISYLVTLTTLGNNATGPVKLFSIIGYVLPKEKVVDKSS